MLAPFSPPPPTPLARLWLTCEGGGRKKERVENNERWLDNLALAKNDAGQNISIVGCFIIKLNQLNTNNLKCYFFYIDIHSKQIKYYVHVGLNYYKQFGIFVTDTLLETKSDLYAIDNELVV